MNKNNVCTNFCGQFMKGFLFLSTLPVSNVLTLGAQNKPFMDDIYYYIENSDVFEVNQEDGRSYYITESDISLNGSWKFYYADNTDGIPANPNNYRRTVLIRPIK